MKLLLHMNMPSGQNDGTHQVIMSVPELRSLADLPAMISHTHGILHGRHLVYDRLGGGQRSWRDRGPMLVNFAHVGKIAVYYEGEHEAR